MSYAGIQATVNFYTMREADLTNELSDIMTSITQASGQTTDLVTSTNDQKSVVRNSAAPDSTEYKTQMDQISGQYEVKLAQITDWESQLETRKQALETEIQATTSYKESFKTALKQNIQKDYKYGGGAATK